VLRYNQSSGYVQIYIDGQWVNWKYFNPNELVPLIPIMTGNNSPSGDVIVSGQYTSHNNYPWHAFDGNPSSYWLSMYNLAGQYIIYHFAKSVSIKQFKFKPFANLSAISRFYISSDGINYKEVKSIQYNNSNELTINLEDEETNVTYIKMSCDTYNFKSDVGDYYTAVIEFQAYGHFE